MRGIGGSQNGGDISASPVGPSMTTSLPLSVRHHQFTQAPFIFIIVINQGEGANTLSD